MFSAKYLLFITFFVQTIIAFQPEFVEPVVNISVASGRDATFTCHVRHLGGYRVGWVKADTKAIQAIHEHVITHNPRVTVSHTDATTWNLHIKAVTEEDSGGYMCQLNTDPMKSQVGHLEVLVPPDFISETSSADVITPEGYPVYLVCRARGNPEPIVTWRREDGEGIAVKDATGGRQLVSSYRGEHLKLQGTRNEMGSYLCISSNGVPPSISKRISLTVQFHPEIVVTNQLVGAPFGTDVTIECNVQASPKPINYWIKDNGEILTNSFKQVVQDISKSPYETRMTVTIRNFQAEDVGSYRCISKNSLGEVENSIRVYEIPGQTTPKKATTLKMPDLQNHIEAKPPFSASIYKKVTPRPTSSASSPEDRIYQSKDFSKTNSKPTKTSSSSNGGGGGMDHNNILKQSGGSLNSIGSSGESSGTRQTHLIRSATNLKEETSRDMFDNSGQSAPPAHTIGLACWLLCLVSSVMVG